MATLHFSAPTSPSGKIFCLNTLTLRRPCVFLLGDVPFVNRKVICSCVNTVRVHWWPLHTQQAALVPSVVAEWLFLHHIPHLGNKKEIQLLRKSLLHLILSIFSWFAQLGTSLFGFCRGISNTNTQMEKIQGFLFLHWYSCTTSFLSKDPKGLVQKP